MQQMATPNRFISLADDDPDNSEGVSTPSLGKAAAKPIDDASADSEGTEFLSVEDEEHDNPYFLQRAQQLPREQWKVAPDMDFRNHHESLRIRQELIDLFHSHKDVETPLGMDDTQQIWRWADVGARKMPGIAFTYPTVEFEDANGMIHPVFSQVDLHQLYQWVTEHLSWLPQFDTVYVYADNRDLAGANPPDYWPWLAPWIQARCNVTGPYGEKTTAIHFPITEETGLHQVHYTWAGPYILEALCFTNPTVNFALIDSDCVPTSLFEIAELVQLMTDDHDRKEAMHHYTMASSTANPPAVLLMTEARAELNAGLIIVTGHAPKLSEDVDMEKGSDDQSSYTPSVDKAQASTDRAHKSRRIDPQATHRTPEEWVALLEQSRAKFLATTLMPYDPAEALQGGLALTPLLGATAKTPLDWTHAWAMLGEWAGTIAFPVPKDGVWPRHGDSRYVHHDYVDRMPPFMTWARPIFEQGALPSLSVLPAEFPILCLPGDKLFQSKEIDLGYSLPPIVHAFHGSKVAMGRKLATQKSEGLQPLPISLLGVEHAPPLWTHPDGCDFIRGTSIKSRQSVMQERKVTDIQALLLKCLWTPVELPNHNNCYTPWPRNCQPANIRCGQNASLPLPNAKIQPLLQALQERLNLATRKAELELNEILSSHDDPRYKEWQKVLLHHLQWQSNPAKTGPLELQCTGLGGSELDPDWDVLLSCKRAAQVYGPSLSKQDDWELKAATVAGTAHAQEYLLLHLAVLPIGLHAWKRVLGVQVEPQIQAQIIARATRLLQFCPITPAHRKPPHPGYMQCLKLFTHLLTSHPLRGISTFPPPTIGREGPDQVIEGQINIKGHSAGSYSGMALETVLQSFPDIEGSTILAAIALPPHLLTNYKRSKRTVQLIHHIADRLCVWVPHRQVLRSLENVGIATTIVSGWRAYLGAAQHNYAHWTKAALPAGRFELYDLENIPGVLPFSVYAQAPLRLISWCSFELPDAAQQLLRKLARLCESSTTTTQELVEVITEKAPHVRTAEDATRYLATLTTINIADRAKMPNYTTMVQNFIGTLPLHMAVYMLDYYLPMLSPYEGYNETGLTHQAAGPVIEPGQPITFEYLFQGSEFGHWKVTGSKDSFAFRHPSLGTMEVLALLESDAHHHKVGPIAVGRLIAIVGWDDAQALRSTDLQVIFGLVLSVSTKTTRKKDETPAQRIQRQCNPRYIEVAFLSEAAADFFAQDQLIALQGRYLESNTHLTVLDAAIIDGKNPVPSSFMLQDVWMFGSTKSTNEITSVAHTHPCRYQLGLGIFNVVTVVEGMDGGKRSYLLHLCGMLLRLVLKPYHDQTDPHAWTRNVALSYAAELDGHVMGALCAVTMALLTNRLDLCIQGLFGAGKSKSMAVLLLALLELDVAHDLKMLFVCKENSGTRSFADMLQWMEPPKPVVNRIGKLVGDQERNKSSYSQTMFDIHPRDRRTALSKCQLILATGGTVAQDLTSQWPTMDNFMQNLFLLVIDEGQQYGTDREIAMISLLKQQPLIVWTGDSQQTPGGIACAAPNAKRSRQLLLAKKHGLRSDKNYYTPYTLADAMESLLSSSSNDSLTALADILHAGESKLGNVWTDELPTEHAADLQRTNEILPGVQSAFDPASPAEKALCPTVVDPKLLEGSVINFQRSLIRLAWILQHAVTLLPMASDLQATLNSETSGVANLHAWGLVLPSSSRVSPVTYHSVVAVRYPMLCRKVDDVWELGSFASGGIPNRPPGFQLVLWDTNPRLNGLVAADLEAVVLRLIRHFPTHACYADGLFVMTTATDHKNNLNRSALKKNNPRSLRVETIANSAGGTAQVAVVAQPSIGFLNGRFNRDGTITEDTEDCLGRITVGLTRSKSTTVLISPVDMLGLMGMAQVLAAIAYGIKGVRRGQTTWQWPHFKGDPERENQAQIARWSINAAPDWHFPPLAIANQYKDRETGQVKRQRYRLVLVKCSRYEWIGRDRREEVYSAVISKHPWTPEQTLPPGFTETILFGYAADATPLPTYICLPSGLYRSRTGRMVEREGKHREIISLPGIFFFDGWRVQPSLTIPANLPQTNDAPDRGTPPGTPRARMTNEKDDTRQPEEEARDILAAAYRNQAENGPNTRRAAIRACKYLKVLVDRHGEVIHRVHRAAREHTQQSKSSEATKQQQSAGGSLPKITPELTSELLHCLNAIPDPWPMAKIAIDMEKPALWVTKMCRLYFADIYARKTRGTPTHYPTPGVEDTLQEVQQLLPALEAKMIEFLAEWMVTLLSPAAQIVKARAPHLTFMFVKEYWFREFYLGLKVTASLGREESYTRIIDGQVRCITQEHVPKGKQLIWNVEFLTIFVPAWMIPPIYHSLRRECIKNAAHSHPYGVRSVRPTWFEDSKIPAQPSKRDSTPFQPMHGLKLVIKEDVMPQEQMPHFPALEKLAANGFLAVETWNNKRAILNFKATVEIPMLGTMIESHGDTLEESHMPLGWPISIDGAVRQFCMHKRDTIQELNGMLAEFNLQRSSVEINCNTNLWAHNAVWNKKFMDPAPGQSLQQLWEASEHYICRKASRSREVPEEAIRQMVREIQHLDPANPPDNLFMHCLGRPQRDQAPPQNAELTRRALEEWERTICENKAIALLEQIQEGRPPLFQKEGGSMLIAMVLDRPLSEAQELVDQPHLFLQEIQQVLDDKKSHPILERMLRAIQGDTATQEATGSNERPSHMKYMDDTQYQ